MLKSGPILLLAAALAGCATGGGTAQSGSSEEQALEAGVQAYDSGQYGEAMRQLQISLNGGLAAADQARAYKYLAFIHCAANRIVVCREYFSRALKADPRFELTAAEVGHPVWGPVYRSVKGGR